jgi:hypothetical protein
LKFAGADTGGERAVEGIDMQVRMLILLALVCITVLLAIFRRGGWARVLVATALLLLQVDVVMIAFDGAGRMVVDAVIRRGGAVKDISEALAALKDVQWPLRLELLLSATGLYVLAVVFRNAQRGVALAESDSDHHSP